MSKKAVEKMGTAELPITTIPVVIGIPEKLPAEFLEILRGRNLDQLADNIRVCDVKICGNDKLSMPEVLVAGNDVYAAKELFRRAKQKTAFKTWLERNGVKYGRAYSYMRVACAAAMEPEIKEMGFTEALEHLGLVSRPPKEREGGGSGAKPPRGKRGKKQEGAPLIVGGIEVLFDGEGYLMEVGDDWQDVLTSAIADTENFPKVLQGHGLLIMPKEKKE